ncbi:[FeFe] hydrogenase H-cluster radical SAM maturase HydE [Halosquirtibacter laminarini]|uniref:[FeFe] hydrogenase H-cluster radical SAM maturase HydE n=1 Tax=Halosquirtibacter laminarini TaxID=3374600 RepID=A0AC61NC76_9BACT|nr:[FeFe] hydrogenase H-cluster radical SAM maturase HydE [Prolixibacteraceae bacterium]
MLSDNNNDIKDLLKSYLITDEKEYIELLSKVEKVTLDNVGDKVYFRGLIELSNYCVKDCYYCGIRKGNTEAHRYELSVSDVLSAIDVAYEQNYGSIVIQAGERTDIQFVDKISEIIIEAKSRYKDHLGITLSLGEQSKETLQKWFDYGAHRYLLRIETSNRELYYKWHPNNALHDYDNRLSTLYSLKEIGYQVGTGVLIGAPFQSVDDLVNDLVFYKTFDIDMVGMGPFISHPNTPLFDKKETSDDLKHRFDLSLRMITSLRLLMPTINIAAATSLQAIDPMGREKAVRAGANIIMPNVTPQKSRADYQLYPNKPCIDEEAWECKGCLEARLSMVHRDIGFGEYGDSPHFFERI